MNALRPSTVRLIVRDIVDVAKVLVKFETRDPPKGDNGLYTYQKYK